MQVLKDIPQVVVVGICDSDPTAPALLEAGDLSIPTYADAEALIRAQPMDWLINVAHISITHRHILSRDLKEVTVIDGQIAELIWRLLIDFYDHVQNNKDHNFTPEQQTESFYTLSWTIIQQVVNIIQPVQNELENIAFHDPLTGLYSRRILVEFLDREVSRAYRQLRPLSVVIADIDHFKPVNDQFGHEVGDGVLKELAELLKKSIRASDLTARYGGEEFVAVLPNTDLGAARLWAERICRRVEKTLKTPDGKEVTISLGVASLNPEAQPQSSDHAQYNVGHLSPSSLLNNADQALYQAKNNGRNRVVAF